jgi:hypothetical protein
MERLVGLEASEIAWSSRGFFYGYAPPEVPHAERFGQRSIRFHAVGTEPASDRVVVPPANDKNASSSAMNPVAVTKDGTRLVVQTSGNWQRSTFAIVDLTKTDWTPVALAADAAIVVENAIYVRTQNEIGRIRGTNAMPEPVMAAPEELLDLDTMDARSSRRREGRRERRHRRSLGVCALGNGSGYCGYDQSCLSTVKR